MTLRRSRMDMRLSSLVFGSMCKLVFFDGRQYNLLEFFEYLLCRLGFNFWKWAVIPGKKHQVLPR